MTLQGIAIGLLVWTGLALTLSFAVRDWPWKWL
jgi:hypothetical protein